MKKTSIIVLSILLITIILVIVDICIYGTDRIYVADYMPTYISNDMPFGILRLKYTTIYMIIPTILCFLLTIIESKVLYKKGILKKDKKSYLTIFLIFIIPVLIESIRIFSLCHYTC